MQSELMRVMRKLKSTVQTERATLIVDMMLDNGVVSTKGSNKPIICLEERISFTTQKDLCACLQCMSRGSVCRHKLCISFTLELLLLDSMAQQKKQGNSNVKGED